MSMGLHSRGLRPRRSSAIILAAEYEPLIDRSSKTGTIFLNLNNGLSKQGTDEKYVDDLVYGNMQFFVLFAKKLIFFRLFFVA